MSTSYFMPTSDSGKADLLDHLASNLARYKDLLVLSDDTCASVSADAKSFRYTVQTMNDMQAYAHHWTVYKNQLRDTVSATTLPLWPMAITFVVPRPDAVHSGIIPRLSALVAQIKTNKNYTPAIGQDLWLVGSSVSVDPSTWKPLLSLQNKAGHPIIAWTKGSASAIEIWVDRSDDANFVMLTINTEPNTNDDSPLPPPGNTAMWKYKAIYRLHDEQVGQWSDVISVSVGG